MMPFAGICAILGMIFIAWRLHEWRESRKAKARYAELQDAHWHLCNAWLHVVSDYKSRASYLDRGYLTPAQDEAVQILNNAIGSLYDEMSECAREF